MEIKEELRAALAAEHNATSEYALRIAGWLTAKYHLVPKEAIELLPNQRVRPASRPSQSPLRFDTDPEALDGYRRDAEINLTLLDAAQRHLTLQHADAIEKLARVLHSVSDASLEDCREQAIELIQHGVTVEK